jgi:hypothetical protein
MLQSQAVDIKLLELLKSLQNSKIFKDYYLVGGTALSLQIGHRKSVDIDLFTNKGMNHEIINEAISSYNYKIVNSSDNILQTIINNIKVDFVNIPYKNIEEVKHEEGINYLGLNDISAMKLHAVSNRGTEAKDFIDVYYLFNYMSLDTMFENYKEKYNTDSIINVKRSLIYFDDIKENSWNAVIMIKDKLEPKKILTKIEDEVTIYNRKLTINIGNNKRGRSG